ncbi:MAG: hypothetical protein RMJ53_10115, partial [Chitinophagales bacterium]|nr:hypothetical protein [Chitinophagales bacterium]MDW8274571.1 hypothetical protein [Chitinophagales bacterium]
MLEFRFFDNKNSCRVTLNDISSNKITGLVINNSLSDYELKIIKESLENLKRKYASDLNHN